MIKVKRLIKNNNGAFSIDAILGLTFFMLAILALMFVSMIIRVQSTMQYALGQTAKEISGYYYLMDKFGLASITSGQNTAGTDKNISDLNSTIGSIVDFTSDLDNSAKSIDLDKDLISNLQQCANETDLNRLKEDAQKLGSNLKTYTEKGTAIDQLKAVIQVFGKSLINRGFSYYVAPLVCEALMPKYLSSDGDLNAFYEKTGINPDSIDFTDSQLLLDGRSIKLVVEYDVDTSKLTFGMINSNLHFRQVATTAAWIQPNGDSKKKISEIKLPETTEAATNNADETN